MDWLFSRQTVIAVAVVGGVFSLAAMLLRAREGREHLAAKADATGYVFMAVSVALFIITGLRGPEN